jgi:hypothetical protein
MGFTFCIHETREGESVCENKRDTEREGERWVLHFALMKHERERERE